MSRSIGPALPPGFALQQSSEEEEDRHHPGPSPRPRASSNSADSAPPKATVGMASQSYGPALPPELEASRGDHKHSNPSPTHSESESDSDEGVIGPLPSAAGVESEDYLWIKKREIESRYQAMKDKLEGKDLETRAGPKREEWMTELPVEFKPLGIGARKFRTKVPEMGDRSVWTDTPADRQRKAEEARSGSKVKKEVPQVTRDAESKYACVTEREKALAQEVKVYNKEHRSESLMDMHRKRRADELKTKGGVSERRPFSRETDLEGPRNLVTPAKRRALMKDSRHSLDSKFQRGARSFL